MVGVGSRLKIWLYSAVVHIGIVHDRRIFIAVPLTTPHHTSSLLLPFASFHFTATLNRLAIKQPRVLRPSSVEHAVIDTLIVEQSCVVNMTELWKGICGTRTTPNHPSRKAQLLHTPAETRAGDLDLELGADVRLHVRQ